VALTAQTRWLAIGVIALADAAWLLSLHISLGWHDLVTTVGVLVFLGALAAFYTYWRPRERLADLAHTAAQIMALFAATGLCSYLVTATGAPLVDETLAAADRALGLDWPAWFAWVHAHATITQILQVAYVSATPQLAIVPTYLALTGQAERNGRLCWELLLSLLLIVPLSGLFPAVSAWVHYDVTTMIRAIHMPDFTALRSGAMHQINLSRMEGLITFPSFHTTLALLFMNALRAHRTAFAIGVTVNGLMLLAIPSEGGHYFADVIAGAAVAVLAIWAAARLDARLREPKLIAVAAGE
jgi:hypothetical protein